MSMLITMKDLVEDEAGELRVQDLMLAERLGMPNPLKIRDLIKRHWDELEAFGGVFTRAVKTSPVGGRPGTEFLLSEAQALCVTILSHAPRAAEVRAALISLYLEVRHGAKATRAENLSISKDEYIDLLRSKIALLEGWSKPKPKKPAPRPLTDAEKADIRRLAAEGLTSAEIGRRIGRSTSAISMLRSGAGI